MRWKLDENLPGELADDLRSLGHEVDSVAEEGLQGAPDVAIARKAAGEQRILVTLDKELGDIRRFAPSRFAGIVLLRLAREGRSAVREALGRALPALSAAPLAGRLAVVSESSVRFRAE